MAEQIPFAPDPKGGFGENFEPRVPCVLVVDTSGSMQGEPIRALNEGLQAYKEDLLADKMASKRVEVAIVTFGPVNTALDFTTAAEFHPPVLVANGDTPLGQAVEHAIDMVAARKQAYKSAGIPYYRPWIFLITDGAPNPNDNWQAAAAKIRQGEASRSLSFYAVGVEGADFGILNQMCVQPRTALKLEGVRFRDLFLWLSGSQSKISRSTQGEAVPLQAPGWATAPS